MNKALHEVMTTRIWSFYPDSFHAYRRTILEAIASRKPYTPNDDDTEGRSFIVTSHDRFQAKTYIGNTDYLNFDKLDPEDKVICVINIEGPILRNGGMCAYGSKEHRDIIMRAADDQHTEGILILMDSPGGSAFSMYDYEMAISHAKSKGKPVIGLVDGMACSAGYFLMALCDEVYFTNTEDIIGCIGAMYATYTQKDGDVNTITQERYVEIYAEGSPYKNKEYRDAAQGNYDEEKKVLNKLCDNFHRVVRANRPEVTDEQLKGLTYPAGEVVGTMVDGQGTFASCIERIEQLAGNTDANPDSTQPNTKENPEQVTPEEKESHHASSVEIINQQPQPQTQNQADMEKKNYPFIQSASGVHALVADESNGLYLVEEMADTLEERLAKADRSESTLTAKLTENKQLNETIELLKKENTETLEKVNAEHAAAVEALNAEHEKATIELNAQLEAANKRIASLESEVNELSEKASGQPLPQNPPKENALEGAQEEQGFRVKSVCEEDLTWEEKAERMEQRKKELSQMGCR